MKIFNALSEKKEEFVPLTPGKVKIYACGPMVYNFIHTGNTRPVIVFSTVRRYFEHKGYDVCYVPNSTDMDDKTIKRVIEEGVDADAVSCRYTGECKEDMAAMNAKPTAVHPQAVQEIYDILETIQTFIDKNHAYVAGDGTVYFRTGSFKEYGRLSHKNLDEFQFGFREIRVTGEEGKEDPNDFVLWESKKEGESFWEPLWCDGRPGQYIERFVISRRYPGEQIDIHIGGKDLIFPHHENGIAQSECANDKNSTAYWMYSVFLNIGSKKMPKFLGNFFTVREISEKYDLQALYFFMFGAHCRSPLSFSADLMETSKNGLECILTCVEKLRDLETKASNGSKTAGEQATTEEADKLRGRYEEAMDDNFNITGAILAILELVKLINTTADESGVKEFVSYMKTITEELCDVLGIITEKKEEVLDSGTEEMIEARQQARKDENFALADETRGKLLDMEIVLEDTRKDAKRKRV